MKEFNLDAALNGEPVMLRDGFDTPEIDIFELYEGWSCWGVTHWQPLPQPPEDE